MAPSQPNAPPFPPVLPAYPFQCISASFFHYKGKNYLVVVGRYSNWPIIEQAQSVSKCLIDCLRCIFGTFCISIHLNFYSHRSNLIVFYCVLYISLKSPLGTWNKRMYVCLYVCIPDECAMDDGPEFTAIATCQFLKDWRVHRHLLSAANPHSNCSTEIHVTTVK